MTALSRSQPLLHVWWARRPLVASRAAVLASLLPENADKTHFCTCSESTAIRCRAKKLDQAGLSARCSG